MKRFNLLFIAALVTSVALLSCRTTKNTTSVKDSVAEAPTDSGELAQGDAATSTQERTFFASIERTACFGLCPTYTMTIYADGFVEYNGIRAVDKIGAYTRTISQARMDSIVTCAKEIGFMEMDASYDDEMVMDLPSATTTVVIEGEKKSVMRRYDFPKRILTLEKLFDNIMNSGSWLSEDGEIYPPER
jgi:hypothetical protein